MAAGYDAFLAACPGVVIDRDIEAALSALPDGSSQSAIRAAVLPLLPEGNPPVYTAGQPPMPPAIMPGASPVFAAALPALPTHLKRFQDSNPDPRDGWSIDDEAATGEDA